MREKKRKMKVNVFGLGYVGSVVSICMASVGHEVVGFYVVKTKVYNINNGRLDLFEPGLEEMLQQVLVGNYSGSLQCVVQGESEHDADVAIVCVGTPSKKGKINVIYNKEKIFTCDKIMSFYVK